MNLANIVRDLSLYSPGGGDTEPGKHPVVAAVEELQNEAAKDPVNKEEIQVQMTSSFKLALLSKKVAIEFPNVGKELHKVEIQWTPWLYQHVDR